MNKHLVTAEEFSNVDWTLYIRLFVIVIFQVSINMQRNEFFSNKVRQLEMLRFVIIQSVFLTQSLFYFKFQLFQLVN